MLIIRLLRVGKRNQPYFKIVVTDKRNAPRKGRFVEEVGFYNPLKKEKNLKTDRIKYWLSVGAKVSDSVHNMLVKEKIIEGKKIPLHKVKKTEEKSIAPEAKKPEEPKVELPKTEAPKEEKPKEEASKPETLKIEPPKEESPETEEVKQ